MGIVTVAHSGYGKFLNTYTHMVKQIDPSAAQLTLVLGPHHEASSEAIEEFKQLENAQVHRSSSKKLGILRNNAIAKTPTEWIMVLDIDDILLPKGLLPIQAVEEHADVILIQWQELDKIRSPLSPEEAAYQNRGKAFFHNANPFRRTFWEGEPYPDDDYPNAIFIAQLVEQHARFVKSHGVSAIHVRRPDSFSVKTLHDPILKQQAYQQRARSAKRLCYYYGA